VQRLGKLGLGHRDDLVLRKLPAKAEADDGLGLLHVRRVLAARTLRRLHQQREREREQERRPPGSPIARRHWRHHDDVVALLSELE